MPAVSKVTSIVSPITRDTIAVALKAAFTNAGYTNLVEDYAATTTSDRILIYRLDFSPTTYGTIFLENRITNLRAISDRITTAWDTNTHAPATGAFTSPYSSSVAFGTTARVNFIAVNHPESRLILIDQGTTTSATLGVIRPAIKPDWWLESSHPFAWIAQTPTMLNQLGFTGAVTQNPYAVTTPYPLLYISALAANSPGNKPDAIAGIATILSPNNRSWAGIFSNEFALTSSTGKRGDMIGEFLMLANGTSAIAVRSNVPS